MRVETYGLAQFADDLRSAGDDIDDLVSKATGKACLNIKKDAQDRVRRHAHLPHLARSFTYEVKVRAGQIVGEVGAQLERKQGPLDGLIENGTPKSAPIPHWRPAADKEIPVWIDHLDQAAAEAIGD